MNNFEPEELLSQAIAGFGNEETDTLGMNNIPIMEEDLIVQQQVERPIPDIEPPTPITPLTRSGSRPLPDPIWPEEQKGPERPKGPRQPIIGTSDKDTLQGNKDDDEISGLGNKDRLNGRGGNDTLDGGGGNDRLLGGNGDDSLLGGSGRDQLIGGKGNDTLDGGGGSDRLTGGKGRDVFVIGNGRGRDLITDFRNGVDKIELAEGIEFDDILIESRGSNTLISIADTGKKIALLRKVSANSISSEDFVGVDVVNNRLAIADVAEFDMFGVGDLEII
ncbi:MAG: hypothetical protein AB4080_06205 [Trichodesmium sp.]